MRFAARLLLLTGLAAMAIAPAAPSRAQFATPEAVVLAVYAHYGVGQNDMRGFRPTEAPSSASSTPVS